MPLEEPVLVSMSDDNGFKEWLRERFGDALDEQVIKNNCETEFRGNKLAEISAWGINLASLAYAAGQASQQERMEAFKNLAYSTADDYQRAMSDIHALVEAVLKGNGLRHVKLNYPEEHKARQIGDSDNGDA